MVGTEFGFTNDAGERSRWLVWAERENAGGRRYLAITIESKNKEGRGYWSIFKASEMENWAKKGLYLTIREN